MISTANLAGSSSSRHQAVPEPPLSRVVPKPVPAALQQDPRTYQLNQLRKRFMPNESNVDNGAATSLIFSLKPSDPDFPFELDHLQCGLKVPKNYPKDGSPPSLTVLNDDIPRGFAINVEKGWRRLVEERHGATLLALTNALDKHLEEFLSAQKAETVKVTIYKDTRHVAAKSANTSAHEVGQAPATTKPSPPAAPVLRRPYVPEETFTRAQISEAKARRAQETRQIETRMGRLGHYHKSNDGIVYTLPLEPKRRAELPAGLRGINSLQLIVPILYPLQPLRVLLNDVASEDAEEVEDLFTEKAKVKRELTLMSHINSLTQSIHLLAKQAQKQKKTVQPVVVNVKDENTAPITSAEQDAAKTAETVDNKGNVQYIPRPPEWYTDVEDGYFDEGSDESTDSEDEDGGAALPLKNPPPPCGVTSQSAERGTAISLPSVELHGIELLQVSILSLSVKCERCKTLNEIGGLKPGIAETSESCRKCATPFSITFRPELVHANSTRAGFIDVVGCTIFDMLPSTFVPTCGKCSTAAQGLVAVRADTTTNVCRECHARFTFKIPEVKFLAYSAGATLPPTSGPRRRQEKLGLHAGEPLPDRGACKHYKKSYRWFRFSCCSKVHPCDKCHDDGENHINEWANRMICGYCSREQNYAVANCTFCGRSVVGRKGRGFWEGGKGTRDQKLMSRKDPRKFKRIGGGETKKD